MEPRDHICLRVPADGAEEIPCRFNVCRGCGVLRVSYCSRPFLICHFVTVDRACSIENIERCIDIDICGLIMSAGENIDGNSVILELPDDRQNLISLDQLAVILKITVFVH